MKRLLIFAMLSCCLTALYSQGCQNILNDARASFEAEKYGNALSLLQKVEICDDKNRLLSKRQTLQKDIFEAIEGQRKIASEAQIVALDEKRRADSALLVANNVLEKLYFFDEKYGLALTRVGIDDEGKTRGSTTSSKEDKTAFRFGFIDREGNEIIPFVFEDATHFSNEDGFSRVSQNRETYLLDTLGRTFLAATSLEELSPRTEALDLIDAELDSLPADLGSYSRLKIIVATNNELTSIPASIGELQALTTLILRGNNIEELPASLWDLEALQRLDLSQNEITDIPEELQNLKELTYLNLSFNEVSTIPESISALTKLSALDLAGNPTMDTLPTQIGNLSNLQYLNLNNNTRQNALLENIFKLTKLRRLKLKNCGLSYLPSSISQLNKLDTLILVGNEFKELPEEVGLMKNLRYLDLSFNRELTDLPASFAQMSGLQVLNLSHIPFNSFPLPITQLGALRELSIKNCKLSEIPEEFSQLGELSRLNISINRLGDIPEPICSLHKLQSLDMTGCSLTRISGPIENLKGLKVLNLSKNLKLTSLPSDIGQLKRLNSLNLSVTSISSLPDEIAGLTQLTQLDLSDNQALKTFPDNILFLPNLSILNLSKTGINSLPSEIKELTSLKTLDVSSTSISALPVEIGSLSRLEEFSLNFTQKLTQLPDEIGDLSKLEMLSVIGAQLIEIPVSIGKLNNLRDLYIPRNQFSSIPTSVGELSSLRYLDISNNPIDTLSENLCKILGKYDVQIDAYLSDSALLTSYCWDVLDERSLELRVNQLYQKAEYKKAYELALYLTERAPDNYRYWFNLSFFACFVEESSTAIAAAKKTLELNSEAEGVNANLALGYLLNNQFKEAKNLYKKWIGTELNGKMAESIFRQDIQALEKAGINHPDFAKIKKLLPEEAEVALQPE